MKTLEASELARRRESASACPAGGVSGRAAKFPAICKHLLFCSLIACGLMASQAALAGSWTPLVNQAPDNIDTMILLSDGTVMAASGIQSSGNIGNAWYLLTPDVHGSYVNGTWTTLSPMNDTRLYYASELLPDGRLFVAGGEYGSGIGSGEIYDPIDNTWTRLPDPHQIMVDAESRVLPNGNVLVAPVLPNPEGSTLIYSPSLNTWTLGPTIVTGFTLDEASWIKLPDDSILTLDTPGTGTNSERYIPSLNQWVKDADMPVVVWDLDKFEMGPGFLCPDGRGFYLGSSGHTAFYTPSGTASPGSWAAGPDIPNSQGTPDAPGAMMATGNILCAVGPNGTVGGATNYPGPTAYYEFDPVAGTFTAEPNPDGITDPNPPFIKRMLCLPDGTILLSRTDPQLYVYTPVGNPVASGKPTITSITVNSDGSFHLVGTLLNGISEGAQYGDDAQMNSNYPLIRITDSKGNVYYLRTYNWSSTGVMTGNKSVSTDFTIPAGVPPGTYSLVVTANGISSDPVTFSGSPEPDLTVVNTTVSGGNGNGIIDFDECNSLFIVVTNIGATNATRVQGTLFTSTPGVTIAQATARYPNVSPGQAATNLNPFEISTTPKFVCGTPISLTLVLKSDQITETRIFTIPTGVPGTPISFNNNFPTNITTSGAGVGSAVQVTNFDSTILHVQVSAYVFESFDFDLTLELVGPDGTTVTLSQNNGLNGQNYGLDCSNNFDRTTFDDDATVSIVSGQAPFLGTYQPQSPLAVFNGKFGTNVNGTWKLVAIDPFSGDFGTIECWSLVLTPAACVDGGGQCPGSDLALGMTGLPNPLLVGSNLTYTMNITNFGPDTASRVTVNQTLPPGAVFVSGTSTSGSVSYTNGIVLADVGTMNVGDTNTVTVVVQPQSPGTIFSTATVGSVEQDPNTANNTVTVSTLVESPQADLSVNLLASPNPVLLDGVLTYTATVANHGPSAATNIVFTNVLPQNVSIVSTASSQGSVVSSANLVVGTLGTLMPGSNAIVTIQARPLVLGQITDTASVGSGVFDQVPGNNTATLNTTVTAASDLILTMTGPASVVVGSNATYQLNVQNFGPSVATDVNLRDTLPAGVVLINAASPQGNVSVSGNIVSCSLASMAPNTNLSLTIILGTSNLFGSVPITEVNSATVTADQADPNSTNNSASISTLVTFPTLNVVPAGYQLLAESSPPTNGMIDPGETVTVSLSLENLGNIDTAPNLTATLLNSGGVTPVGSQVRNYGTLTASGPAAAQTFTFTAGTTNGAAITASLQLQNNGTNLSVVTFPFTLSLSNNFANTNNITIPDHGPGVLFPSTNIVSGLTGLIGKVTVTFTNFNHTYPDDVDMLLVGPKGQNVLLMSHAGTALMTNVQITFDSGVTNADGSPKLVPQAGQILSGSYQPSPYEPDTVYFTNTFGGTVIVPTNNPAPNPPYGTNLDIFNGTSPNGQWFLYVFDSAAGDQGIIIGGWSLGITTGSEVNPVIDLGVSGKAAPNPLIEGANLTYTFTVTNGGPNAATVAQFTNVLPANVSFVSVTNSAHAPCGITAGGAVYCTFTNLPANSSATVTVVVTANAAGSLASTATITGNGGDPNQSNNSATVTTTVNAPVADLALTMTGGTNSVTGSNVLYTITVTNKGPGAALNVVVTDPTMGVLTFSSGSAVGSTGQPGLNNGSVVCNVGTLASGSGATIFLYLSSAQATTVTNTVTATTGSNDPDLANNSASVATAFQAPAPLVVSSCARLISGGSFGGLVPGQTATLALALANVGTADTANLKATLQAGSGVVSPSGTATYGVLVHNGAAVTNNFTFTPSGGNGGMVIATLQLNDGTNNLGNVSFTFNLPATNTFANTAAIVIPDHGAATPYPAVITVSNMSGVLTKATVTLNNFNHQFPNDVEVQLAAPTPSAQNVVLMAHNGGSSPVNNLLFTFDDSASASLPMSSEFTTTPLVSGRFLATDDGVALAFPAPAEGAPSGSALATFNGLTPNGTWLLYVFDNSPGDSGSIANGWSLSLTSITPVNQAADLAVSLAQSGGSLNAHNPVTLTVGVTNKGPASATNVTVTSTSSTGLSFVSTSLGSFSTGTNGQILLNVGTLAPGASTNFTINVTASGSGNYSSAVIVNSDQTDINPQDNTAQVTLQVQGAPKLSAKAVLNKGALNLTLSVTGQPGTYRIVASTNLLTSLNNWVTVGTITNTSSSFQFTDTNAANFPQRFYQVILTP